MKPRKFNLLLGALCMFGTTAFAQEKLPYYNPGEDLSTISWVSDQGASNSWSLDTYGSGTQANPAFSYKPAGTSNTYTAGSTVFTKELDMQTGKVYKLTFVYGSWYTAATMRNYVKFNVALYSQPKYEYKVDNNLFTEIFSKSGGDAFTGTSRPSYTVYFKGDSNKRYLGFGNRGGGNVNRVGLDDIRVVEVDNQTPDKITDLNGLISGKKLTITFNLPKKNVVGDNLTEVQSVKIYRDGSLVKEYTNQTPGAPISYEDNVSTSGEYTYTIVCSNNGSDSEKSLLSATFNSGGNIQAPSRQQEVEPDESKVNGQFGYNYKGRAIYVPGEGIKVKYTYPLASYWVSQIPQGQDKTVATITRQNDGTQLVENDESGEYFDTSLSIDDSAPSLWQYKVDLTRYTNKFTAYSSIVSLNNPLPFHPGKSAAGLNEFTIIDADGDGTTWAYQSNTNDAHYHDGVTSFYVASHNPQGRANGDDWLITPGLIVDKTKTYRVDITVFANEWIETPTQMEVMAGNSNTPEALTDAVIPTLKFKSMKPKTYSAYYNPDFSGNAFFGIHSIESAGSLAVSDLQIYEVSGMLPEAIESINVKYTQPIGTATLSFDAPVKTINGSALTSLQKIELYRNKELIHTFENPRPGETLSYNVEYSTTSQDEFRVIPYTTEGAGLETAVNVMAIEPPYFNSFDRENDFNGFSVIDPQERGYTWAFVGINKAVRSYPDREEGQDDYLITPPIHLEAGNFYRLDFISWLDTEDTAEYYNNQLEVLLGKAPTKEGLTETVIEPFYIRGGFNSKEAFKGWFSVEETGEYYLAWHSMAQPYLGKEIYLDDISISEKIPGTYPGTVTDLKVTPDQTGGLTSTITFNIPVNNLLGNPLTDNVYKTVIVCDGKEIWSASNQKPGTPVTYTQTDVTEGPHLYTVTTYGYDSDKQAAVATIDEDRKVYVGLNKPSWIPSLSVVENPDKYGEVTITWEAPTLDKDGYPLNTKDIYYNVGHVDYNPMTGSTSYKDYVTEGKFEEGLTYTVMANPNSQTFMKFYVDALTKPHNSDLHDGACAAGVGAYYDNITKYMAVGKPYELPFTESFPRSNSSHPMMAEELYGIAMWGFNTRNPQTGVTPVDGDSGLALMEAAVATGSSARLYTGRISLDTDNPVLSLYLYNMSQGPYRDTNEFVVSIREDNGEFKEIAHKSVDEWTDGIPGWHKITVSLADYAHKVVYIGFEGVGRRFYSYPGEEELISFTHIDKVLVDEHPHSDVAVKAVNNTQAYVGTDHSVTVTLKNNGAKHVESALVTLYMDGSVLDTKTVTGIAPGELSNVIFTNAIGRDNLGKHKYSAQVYMRDDVDNIDNKTEGEEFEVFENEYPTVRNLTATPDEVSVKLEWVAPDVPESAMAITDDFEGYNPWSTMYTGIGDYTLVDADGIPVGGFQQDGFPIEYGSKQSFTVWDMDFIGPDGTKFFGGDARYTAHSGSNCLVSMYPYNMGYCDDRLISPLLTGEAQTISFYARGLAEAYPEKFQVYYSLNGTDFSDFQPNFFAQETATGSWTEYKYNLPEGTRYFMIRHYSQGGYFFFLDDLTYIPQGYETLNLKGYNVYKNGKKMNDALITATNWTDTESNKNNDVAYGVSAVYETGESQLENVSVVSAGIDSVDGDSLKVYAEEGAIIISGANGDMYMVTMPNGAITARGITDDYTRIGVAAGMYIVRVGNRTVKLVVR